MSLSIMYAGLHSGNRTHQPERGAARPAQSGWPGPRRPAPPSACRSRRDRNSISSIPSASSTASNPCSAAAVAALLAVLVPLLLAQAGAWIGSRRAWWRTGSHVWPGKVLGDLRMTGEQTGTYVQATR